MEGEETESVQSLQGGGGGGGGAECVQLVVEFSGEGEGFGRREEVQPGIGRGEDAGLDPVRVHERQLFLDTPVLPSNRPATCRGGIHIFPW